MFFIFVPRPSEKIYILYDKDKIYCNLEIIKNNLQKESFLICQDLEAINFVKKSNNKSKYINLNQLKKFDTISYKNLLKRFNNNKLNQEKNSFDLLNRNKKIDFNLIIKHNYSNKIKIISVKQIQVLCSYKIE